MCENNRNYNLKGGECMCENKNSRFDSLEQAQIEEIEVHAELLKQKEILRNELELDNKKHMDAIMQNLSKSQMYHLSSHERYTMVNNEVKNNEVTNEQPVKDAFLKGRDKIIASLIIIVIILLAIGISPSGAWYELLQTSYVETLVDIFKMSMIGVGIYLTVKLFKRSDNK